MYNNKKLYKARINLQYKRDLVSNLLTDVRNNYKSNTIDKKQKQLISNILKDRISKIDNKLLKISKALYGIK